MKNVVRVLALMIFSAFILYLMSQWGLLKFGDIMVAFRQGKQWIAVIILTQLLLSFLLLLRYVFLLKIFEVDVHWNQASAATFVSNAVGQWAPGALAVIEFIRVGLMFGAKHKSEASLNSERSLKMRLAATSLFDRLLGFFTMLATGGICSAVLLVLKWNEEIKTGHFFALVLLTVFSLSGAVFIGLLPWAARRNFTIRVLKMFSEMGPESAELKNFSHKIARLISKISLKLEVLRLEIVLGSAYLPALLLPILASLGCLAASALSIYFASCATGDRIDLGAIFATYPIVAISTLLPIGFGGMGGQQLVAVAIFGIFNLSGSAVASASLLQNGLLLIENTLLGLLFAHLSAGQIKAILAKRREVTE